MRKAGECLGQPACWSYDHKPRVIFSLPLVTQFSPSFLRCVSLLVSLLLRSPNLQFPKQPD